MHQGAEQASADLADVASLVQSQVDAGMCREEVIDALCSSWIPRLEGLAHCSQADKARLTAALSSGPWSDEQRKELARSILIGPSEASSKRKRPNQKCSYFENFIPEECWVKLRDTTQYSQLTRVSLLAGVAHSIGIECPDQPTLFRMVSVLAYCEKNFDMAQDEVHKLMDKIQSMIKSMPKTAEIPYVVHYPPTAHALPNAIRDQAYPGGLPVEVDIMELNMVLGDNKMRGRKRDNLPDWLQHVPEAYEGLVMQQVHATKKCRAGSSLDAVTMQPPPTTPLPSASLLRGNIKGAHSPLPLAQVKSELGVASTALAAKGAADADEQADDRALSGASVDKVTKKEDSSRGEAPGKAPSLTIAAWEESLVKGMLAGKGLKKKPAKSPDGPEADTVQKKPSAGPTLKRPAAHMPYAGNIDLSSIFAGLRPRKGHVTRKVFTSSAYHKARTLAMQSGMSADQAKAIGRDAANKAGQIFDKP